MTKRIIAVMLFAGLALSACDPTNPSTNIVTDVGTLSRSSTGLSPAQKELRTRDRAYATSRAQGAVVGALVGGGLCLAMGGDERACAASAVAGGAVGYASTSYVARQNQSFQASQATLRADIQQARADEKILAGNVKAAQNALAYQKSEVARLNQALSAGQVSTADARAKYQTMQADLQAVRDLERTAEQRLSGLQRSRQQYAAVGAPTGELAQSAVNQQAQINRLKQVEDAMIGVLDSVPSSIKGS